jgi:hypothetical protein
MILLGTSISGRQGDTARRESAAQASLAALVASGSADAVTLLFRDEMPPVGGAIPSLARLTQDAPGVSGLPGPRKPIVSEMIDVLADEAHRRGMSRVALVNGDILVAPAAVDRIASTDAPFIAMSRIDTGGGEPDASMLYGVDLIAVDTAFWRRTRRLFRAYVLGEEIWDNVYTAIGLCHGGALFNRDRLLLHERHETRKGTLPFARYVHLLGARDRAYFTRWCTYIARLEPLRARGAAADEELALARSVFVPPAPMEQYLDVARGAWWRAKRFAGA